MSVGSTPCLGSAALQSCQQIGSAALQGCQRTQGRPKGLRNGSKSGRPNGLRYRIAAAIAVSGVAAAALIAQPARPPNVLLITIDTVRADHVGAYGDVTASTPTLDRLAREGVRFADATTQAPLTGPAHAAILTGTYPARLGLRDNATSPLPPSATTVADAFKARGYRTGGFIGAFILDRQYGFAKGFDHFDSGFAGFTTPGRLQVRRPADEVVDAALKWIDESPSASGTPHPALRTPHSAPWFAWLHLYDAHAPYEPPARYRQRFPRAPYDAAVAYVDDAVKRVVTALEAAGALDRTIVCVLADHGEGLGDHGEAEHGFLLYDSTLHVPWILRLPGRRHAGLVVGEQVRTIDVLPTLVALAGGSAPAGIDGESLVPLLDGRARRDPPPSYAETFYPKLHFGWSELKSVRVGTWKYIDAPQPELYDVAHDRRESRNMIDARATLAGGLAAEATRIEGTFGEAASREAPQPDPDTLARLRSLGYIGVASPGASKARGPDPKQMIAGLAAYRTKMTRATALLQHGNGAAAVPLLKELLASNDRSYELHLFLGDAYANLKQYREAFDEYTAAELLNPQSAEPVLAAARARLDMGNADEALKLIDRAERLEPHTDEVGIVRGMVHERQQAWAPAMADYGAAVAANPSNTQARLRLATLAMRLGQYDEAREQFAALVRLKYRPSRMHFALGEVAEHQGDRTRAVAEYRDALRLEPTLADAASALKRLGADASR